jgi:hypothetical protein
VAAQDPLEALLHPEEVEQSDRTIELDEQVHVAAGLGVAARNRAEDVERAHSEHCELRSLRGKSAQDLFARHASMIEPPRSRGQRAQRPPGSRRGGDHIRRFKLPDRPSGPLR